MRTSAVLPIRKGFIMFVVYEWLATVTDFFAGTPCNILNAIHVVVFRTQFRHGRGVDRDGCHERDHKQYARRSPERPVPGILLIGLFCVGAAHLLKRLLAAVETGAVKKGGKHDTSRLASRRTLRRTFQTEYSQPC